jgi:hypothetical protein
MSGSCVQPPHNEKVHVPTQRLLGGITLRRRRQIRQILECIERSNLILDGLGGTKHGRAVRGQQ